MKNKNVFLIFNISKKHNENKIRLAVVSERIWNGRKMKMGIILLK
jgi:hypothetical protein